ncbi:MAG: Tim44/TimA family putative adaptor protein, partial [Hyphomicrobiales bacterium]
GNYYYENYSGSDGIIALGENEGLDYSAKLIKSFKEFDKLPGSIYHQINFQDGLKILKNVKSNAGLVAIPCVLEGIYNYIFSKEPELVNKINLTIGLLCGWTYSHKSIDAMKQYHKIEEKVEKPEVIKLNQQFQEFSDEINLLEKNIKSFSIDYFLDGAKKAYEMTLIAYSEENKETLNMLLEKNIYDEFLESIEIRNNNNQKLEYSLIKVNKLDIRDIDINKNIAKIDLHIDADNEFVLTELKDEEKSINKNKAHVKEIWTFTKKLNSRNPNWKVSEISRLN